MPRHSGRQAADASGLAKERAEVIVDALFGSIAEALYHGEQVDSVASTVSVSDAAGRTPPATPTGVGFPGSSWLVPIPSKRYWAAT